MNEKTITSYSSAQLELLVLEAQDGDQTALVKLFQFYNPALTRYGYLQCNDSELAQDASQDAWLSCCRKIKQLKDPSAFRAWLFSALRNRIIDLIRQNNARERRQDILKQEASQTVIDDVPPSDQAQHLTTLPLWNAINALPLQERQCIYLYYQEEFSTKEIALTLSISQGTVKSQLSRGRNHLQAALNDSKD